jgi:hypothetical protein
MSSWLARLGGRRWRLIAVTGVLMLCAGVAYGYFSGTGTGTAAAQTGALNAASWQNATPGAGTVALSWNAVTAPDGGPVAYYVTRDGANTGGTCAVASSPTAATSCTDSGLAAGTYHYTVTAVWQSWTATSVSQSVTVNSGALDHFVVDNPGTQTAGAQFNVTITAVDSAGNRVTSYAGSQALSFSGPGSAPGGQGPSYASSVSFTGGVGTAPVTLYQAQTTTLTAAAGTVSGTSGSFAVGATTATGFKLSTPSPTAGTAFNETITAIDTYGNTATGYTGAQKLSFSGPSNAPNGTSSPGYPGSVTFSAGVGTASITLVNAQTTTLTATQGALNGSSAPFTVAGATASTFSLANPGPLTAGTAFNETITAVDTNGNTATGYTGAKTVAFTGPGSSPTGATPTYPGTLTFTGGVATASITLVDAQTTTLTATQAAVTGTSAAFTVSDGGASAFRVATPGTQTAGIAFNETITALDAYGNTATSYSGAQTLTFTGPANSPSEAKPTYPGSVTFTAGVGTASITLTDAQTTTLIATAASVTGSSGSFTVNAGAASNLAITSAVSGGVSPAANLGPITVQEQDSSGNASTTAVTVNLSSSGTTGEFATSLGGMAVTSVNIPAGSSTATFYYGNTTPGTPTMTVSATGLTSGTQQATISPVAGLGIVAVGGTGHPVAACGTPSSNDTCTVSGVGMSGNVTYYVTFVNASGTQVVYSASQASTITESGENSGTVTIAAGASSSNPNTLTASHTGDSSKVSTLTFGTYTLTIQVQS